MHSQPPAAVQAIITDGKIVEADESFELENGKKAQYPGDFGKPEEDCNCRCLALTRARWELDEEELKQLKERAEFFGLDKKDDFKTFEEKYLKAADKVQTGGNVIEYMRMMERKGKQASAEYDKIRETDDVALVAKASGMTVEDIRTIKNHVFFNEHELYDGRGRFAPDYDMAVAWRRLVEGRPEERDILLLAHELLENQYEMEYNMSASEAHAKASEKYDWAAVIYEMFGEDGEPDGLL